MMLRTHEERCGAPGVKPRVCCNSARRAVDGRKINKMCKLHVVVSGGTSSGMSGSGGRSSSSPWRQAAGRRTPPLIRAGPGPVSARRPPRSERRPHRAAYHQRAHERQRSHVHDDARPHPQLARLRINIVGDLDASYTDVLLRRLGQGLRRRLRRRPPAARRRSRGRPGRPRTLMTAPRRTRRAAFPSGRRP